MIAQIAHGEDMELSRTERQETGTEAFHVGPMAAGERSREFEHDSAGLYTSMVEEFHHGRGFFLELMVVLIPLIEIAFLFRGKGQVNYVNCFDQSHDR